MTERVEVVTTDIMEETEMRTKSLENYKKTEEELKRYKFKDRKVKSYYKSQNRIIDSFLKLDKLNTEYDQLTTSTGDGDAARQEKESQDLKIKIAIYGSLIANVLLFIANCYVAFKSSSASVFGAALDSFMDLASSVILFVINYLLARGGSKYPAGKGRFEPLGVVVLSTFMFTLAILLIEKGITVSIASSVNLEFSVLLISISSTTIGIKFVLWLYCRLLYYSPSAKALTLDHQNDILANGCGLGFGLLGYYFYYRIDSIGSLFIAIYIMVRWFMMGYQHLKYMVGETAEPAVMQHFTFLAFKHDERIISIDTVRAFYLGMGFLVEIDIVLPPTMPLQEAHDIGESLQIKLESLDNVERAFVHIDYETIHQPEHKRT